MTERCAWCGRFVSYYDETVMGYVPYGGYMDTEPPDEEIVCGKCWKKQKGGDWAVTSDNCWRGPYQRFPSGDDEVKVEGGGADIMR